jgi:eukaryotic-like serine/threonine-protein kinase
VERFGKTNDPAIAERMAKDCLILPSSGADLDVVADMADLAIAAGPDHWGATFFQFAKGLSEYRQGHFTSAVQRMQQVLVMPGEFVFRDAEAYLVLAMAHHQLNQSDEARAALAEGSSIIEAKPTVGIRALGVDWNDWLIAHALRREATALIEGPSPATPEPPK